jgi:hypothetical protein
MARRITGYSAGSVVAIVTSEGAFGATLGLVHAGTTLASAAGFVGGAVPNCPLNRRWAWRDRRGRDRGTEISLYMAVALASLLVSAVVTHWAENGARHLTAPRLTRGARHSTGCRGWWLRRPANVLPLVRGQPPARALVLEAPPVVTQMDFEEFFADERDDFAPFEVPVEIESPSPTLGWLGMIEYTPDEASLRLRQFAYGMYYFARDRAGTALRWDDEPDRAAQGVLLRRASGSEDVGVLASENFDLLWRTLIGVVRADRFNEGVVARHSTALARIANELRSRLIAERRRARRAPSPDD